MSLITRCPVCTTRFKVVPDQLRVSEGWVRCGRCGGAFDANVHLQGDGRATLPSSPAPAVRVPVAQIGSKIEHTTSQTFVSAGELGLDNEREIRVESVSELAQESAAKLKWPEVSSLSYGALVDARFGVVFRPDLAAHVEIPGEEFVPQAPEVDVVSGGVAVEPLWEASPTLRCAEVYVPPVNRPLALAPIPLPVQALTFMRTADKDAIWSKSWARRSMTVLAVLLVAALGLQATLHERDRLAASVPYLRPALTAMCGALECRIAPFKQIDSLVIDASSFVKVRGDVYRLNLTLKNTAPLDVAAPSVELTLTDTQDLPLIRHVLSASELGAQQSTLLAGGELVTVVPLNVKTEGSAERISGYRLRVFYP